MHGVDDFTAMALDPFGRIYAVRRVGEQDFLVQIDNEFNADLGADVRGVGLRGAGVAEGLGILGIDGTDDATLDATLNGLDALLATLQMPSGIPVGTVTLGSAGPVNAAILAVQILALGRPALRKKLVAHKRALKKKVEKGNRNVQASLAGGQAKG